MTMASADQIFTLRGPVFCIEPRGIKYDSVDDVAPFIKALSDEAVQPVIEEIKLSGNSFGVDACIALAGAIKSLSNIKVVNMSDIFTGRLRSEIPKCLVAFADALIDKPSLHSIDFSDNAFGPDGLKPLVPLISARTSLQTIRLNNTGLGPQGGQILAEALLAAHENNVKAKKPSQLRVLVCGRSRLENGSMVKLAQAFKSHALLSEIVMPQDGIRPEGIAELLQGLMTCTELEILDLQDNTFTTSGGRALAAALPAWTKLKKLNVGDCMLEAKGCLALIDALKSSTIPDLEVLNLQYNEMNEDGARALALILQRFPKLVQLELNGNCFAEDGDGADAVRDALESMDKSEALGTLSDMEEEESDEEVESGSEDELAEELSKVAVSK